MLLKPGIHRSVFSAPTVFLVLREWSAIGIGNSGPVQEDSYLLGAFGDADDQKRPASARI